MEEDSSRGVFTETFECDIKNSVKSKISYEKYKITSPIMNPIHSAQYSSSQTKYKVSHPIQTVKYKIESKIRQKFGGHGMFGNAFADASCAEVEEEL